MSRIGKKPVPIPSGVKVAVVGQTVEVQGPKGALSHTVPASLTVEVGDGHLLVRRAGESRTARALHGLTRSLLANMVLGVKEGFEKKLEIIGIGYRAQLAGRALTLTLGYSHPVIYQIPEGIQVEVDRQTQITVRGYDKAAVGQVAAEIRAFRKPDPYKGKGIKYSNEVIRRKVGKAGAK
jgi:large subunit ribosomal protein L6